MFMSTSLEILTKIELTGKEDKFEYRINVAHFLNIMSCAIQIVPAWPQSSSKSEEEEDSIGRIRDVAGHH